MTERGPCRSCGERDNRLCDCGVPTHSITLEEYQQLPDEVRGRIGAWLQREGLTDKRVRQFTLLEGAIKAEVMRLDDDGHVHVIPGTDEIAKAWVVFPISTAPPREALS